MVMPSAIPGNQYSIAGVARAAWSRRLIDELLRNGEFDPLAMATKKQAPKVRD